MSSQPPSGPAIRPIGLEVHRPVGPDVAWRAITNPHRNLLSGA